jgi:chloramphenicol 3-O-phosphotransferase
VDGGVEEAVLVSGVYGSGKSSVAQEIADLLEEQNVPYALLDLDFLAWFDTGSEGGPTEHSMMLRNLSALVGNYLAVGVQFFVLAYAIRGRAELDSLKAELPMPLRVVGLTVPLREIERRLHSDPTTGETTCAGRPPGLRPPSVPASKTRRSRTTARSGRWR